MAETKKGRIFMAAVLGMTLAAAVFFPLFFNMPSRLIPREVLFGLPEKISPQISPDGSLVAFLAPSTRVSPEPVILSEAKNLIFGFFGRRPQNDKKISKVLNIWVCDRKTGKDRVLTQDQGRGIHFYAWAPDGRSVLYLQDQGGNENWHLFKIDLSGGPARDLTPFEGVQARVLRIDKHFPDTILIELNKEDISRHDVYRLELPTGALELAARNPGQISDWIVDAAMKVRGAVAALPGGGYEVRVRDTEDAPWRKLFSWDLEDSMTSGVVGFSKDGKELFLKDSRGIDTARLVKMDIATGKTETLFSDPEYDVGGVVMDPDDREIDMVSVNRARNEWTALRSGVREDLEILRKTGPGDLLFLNRSNDGRYWVIGLDNDVSPLKYYIYDKKNKTAEFLFTHRPALLQYRLAPMEPVTVRARDGLKLQGYLTFPKGRKKSFPMVLFVHGGPWTRDGWGYDPVAQWLADRGYACLQINFRGSTGFGKKFVNAGNKEWGRKMQDDLSDAAAWAARRGIADPQRIGIMGASYGGYAALAAAAFTPEVFRCAVDMFGPSDLAALIRSMPPYWSVEKANILKRMGDPDTESAFLKERSPLFFSDRIRIPVLIAQGANDPRTPKSESDRMVEALRQRNVECEYVVFPDEGHGFVKPENRLKFFRTAEAFLSRHLKGRYQK
jgi:dipeptidyl aminopeptidase/acylaminoacyl peptidase